MTLSEFSTFYSSIESAISNNMLFDATRRLSLICNKLGYNDLISKIAVVKSNYGYLLDYFVSNVSDPSRDDMILSLKCELFDINDQLARRLIYKENSFPLLSVSDVNVNDSVEMLLVPVLDETLSMETRHRAISILFNFLVARAYLLPSDNISPIYDLFQNASVKLVVKSQIISALTISLLNHFSEWTLLLLFKVYSLTETDLRLRIRALVGIYFAIFRYSKRLPSYPEIINQLSEIKQTSDFDSSMSLLISQFIKSRNTDFLNAKMEKQIMPNIMKYSTSFDKLRKNKSFNIDDLIEANPEWQKMFDDEELNSNLKSITEMQFDGADIFMSAFKQIKQHPFFRELYNWFVEFVPSHPKIVSKAPEDILLTLSNDSFNSNIDKYTLALTISGMPEDMQKMIVEQLRQSNDMLEQKFAAETHSLSGKMKLHMKNIVQDWYKFFKFVGMGAFVKNPFTYMPLIDDALITSDLKNIDNILLSCIDYTLKYEKFEEAIPYINKSLSLPNSDSETLYQRLGYCYQQLSDHQAAIEAFKKAEIFNADNKWLVQHMAQTYKSMGDYSNALKYYLKLNELSPNRVSVILNIGHVYLELDDIELAIKYYYKADYLAGGSSKTARPIAWCEFKRGDYEKSLKYYESIDARDITPYDMLNIGHVYFVINNIPKALSYYTNSIRLLNSDSNNFRHLIMQDANILIDKGVSESSLSLMIDKACFDADSES